MRLLITLLAAIFCAALAKYKGGVDLPADG
jgi:hypothetical protein